MLALVLALAVLPSTPAAPPKWVALVHVSGDAPKAWAKPLQEAAELNKQSSAWAPPPQVTLEEAQLALGCAGWTHACAGQIAGMTGASAALVVDVASKDAGVVITVQALKASGAPLGPEDKLELPGTTDKDLEIAKDFVKTAPRAHALAYLVVDSDVAGTEVVLDGERKGKTRFEEAVSPGEHKLVLRAEGKAEVQKTIDLKPGMLTTYVIPMSAAGPPVETSTPVGVPTNDHEVTTTTPAPPVPAPGAAPSASVASPVGWSLVGVGSLVAVAGGVIGGAAIYDLYLKREPCSAPGGTCAPVAPVMFGLYGSTCTADNHDKQCGISRTQFFGQNGQGGDAPSWIGGGAAAFGVGALILGTGVALATSDLGEDADAAAGEPPPPATAASR